MRLPPVRGELTPYSGCPNVYCVAARLSTAAFGASTSSVRRARRLAPTNRRFRDLTPTKKALDPQFLHEVLRVLDADH